MIRLANEWEIDLLIQQLVINENENATEFGEDRDWFEKFIAQNKAEKNYHKQIKVEKSITVFAHELEDSNFILLTFMCFDETDFPSEYLLVQHFFSLNKETKVVLELLDSDTIQYGILA